MSKLKQIIRHRDNGMALQTISKTVGIARNTVKKYLQLIESKGLGYGDLLDLGDEDLDALLADPGHTSEQRYVDLEDFFPYMEEELRRTGVNRWFLWGEYRQKHPDGYSYSQFCESFRQWRIGRAVSMRMEHLPGDKLFIDFTGDKIPIVDALTGEITEAEVYVATLGYSQYSFVEALESQKKDDFIASSENALHYFGGAPKALVPDNLRSAVTKANNYEPLINGDFLDFANHYGCTVFPARSRKPQDKSLVEKTVSIIYTRIFATLRNRVYHDLKSLNRDILECLEKHHNIPFQKRPETRKELFEKEEKAALQPLPTGRFERKEFKLVTVTKTAHVCLGQDKHYYSVPYRFIGKKVKMVYSHSSVAIFYNKERIALHGRSKKFHGYTTVKDHMPSAHRFVSDWNPDFFLNWAMGIHPDVHSYIKKILESYTYPEQAYKSCLGILGYDKKAGRDRLVPAVRRAMDYNSFSYSVITRILGSGLDRLASELEDRDRQTVKHENIRGSENYK